MKRKTLLDQCGNSHLDAVAMFDQNGTMVYANNSFERLYNSLHIPIREAFKRKIKHFETDLHKSGKTSEKGRFVLSPLGKEINIVVYLLNRSGSEETHLLVLVKPNELLNEFQHFSPVKTIIPSENKTEASPQERFSPFSKLIGEDPKIRTVLLTAKKAAASDYPVLITGESGTGKEILARMIHKTSARSKKKFVDINCAAIPGQLIDSELFGYEKGAFTGAISGGRHGLFYEAHLGTLFLDEIADASLQTQAKLLRVLDEGFFKRIGGKKNIEVDVRIISATNKDLSQMIQNRNFREDLLYRLNTISIHLPSLRERPKDIALLANYFLGQHARQQKRDFMFSPGCREVLESYHWPGNVRELKGVVDYMVTMVTGSTITENNLPVFFLSGEKRTPEETGSQLDSTGENREREGPLASIVQRVEKEVIREVLQKAKNRSEAINMLGISRRTFYTKIKQYNLD